MLKLNKKQLEKLSDIASDLGLVAIASVVLPAVLDKFDILKILSGLAVSIGFWWTSLFFRR